MEDSFAFRFPLTMLLVPLLLFISSCARPAPQPLSITRPTPSPVRYPAVAGSFYPQDAETLIQVVDGLLAQAEKVEGKPIALIVPHAGYEYSGLVAAHAYKQLEGADYDVFVIIGNNHYDPEFDLVSVYAEGAFETPLGRLPIDSDLAKALIASEERIVFDPLVHAKEHSIEVELPFLQRLYGEPKIVPIIVGAPSQENCRALSEALVKTLSGKNALIIASSDLSHYLGYEDAIRVDEATLTAIETMSPQVLNQTIQKYMGQRIAGLACLLCGEGPVKVAMIVAKELGADEVTVLKYANSGDMVPTRRDQVVGYGAVMFWRRGS